MVYAVAAFCARFPSLSAEIVGVAASAAATTFPIANDGVRELVASAVGVASFLGWTYVIEPDETTLGVESTPVEKNSKPSLTR